MRKSLLEHSGNSKFKTVLLSATYTKTDIELLEIMFGPYDKINFFSYNQMRPEPKYYFYEINDKKSQYESITELIKFIPKPAIIYTTRVFEQAVPLYESILSAGLKSVRIFTGSEKITSNTDRQEIIRDWSEGNIDVIVATSAFGVGMDKSDIRTVIHVTIPETVERFYQEVGRGGERW